MKIKNNNSDLGLRSGSKTRTRKDGGFGRDRPSNLGSMIMVAGTVMPTTSSVVRQVLGEPVQHESSKQEYTSTKNNRQHSESTTYLL